MFQILVNIIGVIVAVSLGIIVFAVCVAVVRIALDGVLVIVKTLTQTEVKHEQSQEQTASDELDAQSEEQ